MSNKFNFKDKSILNGESNTFVKNSVFYYGIVTSVVDEFDAGHIKVRINGVDNHINNIDLPKAFPLLPKFFFIKPKVGETVMIFTPENDNPFIDRFYIGPLVSQPQDLKDSRIESAKSGLDSGFKDLSSAPSKIPESKGAFSNGEDTTIQGRENADIIFKKNEVLLRAGKYDENKVIKGIPIFNTKNQSYIQIRNSFKPSDSNKKIGLINIVSNKINLLTHEDGSPVFNLNDQISMISDEELLKILKTAHPVPFGDLLIEYLILMRNVLLNHVHAYPGMKGQDLNGANDIQKLLEYDIKKLVSKNIKVN